MSPSNPGWKPFSTKLPPLPRLFGSSRSALAVALVLGCNTVEQPDSQVWVLDGNTGREHWHAKVDAGLLGRPTVFREQLELERYAACSGATLGHVAFDWDSGASRSAQTDGMLDVDGDWLLRKSDDGTRVELLGGSPLAVQNEAPLLESADGGRIGEAYFSADLVILSVEPATCCDVTLIALSREDFRERFRVTFPNATRVIPFRHRSSEDPILAVTVQGNGGASRWVGLDARTGTEAWSRVVGEVGLSTWIDGFAATVVGDRLLAIDAETIRALDSTTGAEIWSVESTDAGRSALGEHALYVVSCPNDAGGNAPCAISSIDLANGKPSWTESLGAPLGSEAVVAGSSVVVFGGEALRAFDVDDGAQRWSREFQSTGTRGWHLSSRDSTLVLSRSADLSGCD
jgi:outer membrane protein assembly factor BamB